ncbi:Putative alcohol dehydrogenase, iron-type/glycerol dehydrogenase GldA [Septoria linicola]|uniref:Alcohol dehydrogenase, iron-type/glycerol dehydrogenase GldA n=1 Tax=Septoria linicola TaxID=215465 RepID=A0A9Q9B3Q9_9PEZI|nr:putative alcohol dehydrogenase, iron-type/glycerol dehydrogenase GldA [Septoria linicola]USW57655.1 Putative alcohol dehydrogenase, iron-type/glycerol dehydrogenase GldA [Septoria linicola]
MATLPEETHRLAFPSLPDLENPAYVSYGKTHHEACAHHVKETYDAKRVYIVASGSLSKNTDEVDKLKAALRDRVVDDVLEATKDAKERGADCIVTIGGGSLSDGAKAMLLFLANDVTSVDAIYGLAERIPRSGSSAFARSKAIPIIAPTMPLLCIPTTLSGGEFSHFTGGTDPKNNLKLTMGHPFCGPRLLIFDPALSITSPEWVWLSTGVRAIDHAVETFCQTNVPDEDVDKASLDAFKSVVLNLLITKRDWTNEEARLKSQLGVNSAMIMLKKDILPGASHGIGHQLGPFGVGHGETSCILLPAILKWNAKVNGKKQEQLKTVMWQESPIREVLQARGLAEKNSDAGDALDAIFRELGMPRSMAEKNIGRDQFDSLAENSLKDAMTKANPRPVKTKADVVEILGMCAG